MIDLAHLLAQQQVAIGMAAAAAAGGLLYSLKALPGQLWSVLREQFSATLTVEGRDLIYEHLNLWFSRQEAVSHARRMMLQQEYDYDRSDWRWKFTLGRGLHLLWTNGRPILVNRKVSEGGEMAKLMGAGLSQSISITTLGRSQKVIRRIVQEAEAIYNLDGHVRVYFWNQHAYELADRRPPRDLDTVYLPTGQKARLVDDVQAFTAARAVYRKRGTPYRRGYLFEGPPGTGKTSLIFALAGLIGRAVFVVNLSNVSGDNGLLAAFNAVGADGVVVIEDIDTAEITKDRHLVAAQQLAQAEAGVPSMLRPATAGITLSGLLNAIDGVAAREGRLLFVTSNHAGKLDPALLRSGRIDVRESIDRLSAEPAWEMFQAFRPGAQRAEFEGLVAPRLPMAAADLQNLLQEGEAAGAEGGAEVIDLQARAKG